MANILNSMCLGHLQIKTMVGNREGMGKACGKQEGICKGHSVQGWPSSPVWVGLRSFVGMCSAKNVIEPGDLEQYVTTQCPEGTKSRFHTRTTKFKAGKRVGKKVWDRLKIQAMMGGKKVIILTTLCSSVFHESTDSNTHVLVLRLQRICTTCFYTCSFSNTCALFYSSVS